MTTGDRLLLLLVLAAIAYLVLPRKSSPPNEPASNRPPRQPARYSDDRDQVTPATIDQLSDPAITPKEVVRLLRLRHAELEEFLQDESLSTAYRMRSGEP